MFSNSYSHSQIYKEYTNNIRPGVAPLPSPPQPYLVKGERMVLPLHPDAQRCTVRQALYCTRRRGRGAHAAIDADVALELDQGVLIEFFRCFDVFRCFFWGRGEGDLFVAVDELDQDVLCSIDNLPRS